MTEKIRSWAERYNECAILKASDERHNVTEIKGFLSGLRMLRWIQLGEEPCGLEDGPPKHILSPMSGWGIPEDQAGMCTIQTWENSSPKQTRKKYKFDKKGGLK